MNRDDGTAAICMQVDFIFVVEVVNLRMEFSLGRQSLTLRLDTGSTWFLKLLASNSRHIDSWFHTYPYTAKNNKKIRCIEFRTRIFGFLDRSEVFVVLCSVRVNLKLVFHISSESKQHTNFGDVSRLR
jgi:hypothetical protein